ncbi:hypothetical protein B6V01_001675 [Methanosarcinales archaeon ex4572_44]|nr:MAG: hypothetical protein B6U67_01495 [Methanosarcinales archaeon ex4484_138]PHP45927.1 MAG: hypothetical protein B6V01_001675 [Methanosarcinales archaeon ex4572_44]RLG27050.1 MAG: hypothetical protein DRN85_01205 [Methanosarcinales archaeon]RLG28471.1 MAG: hypothetical protein DRN70_00505 [Methanosarcinales archaeon]
MRLRAEFEIGLGAASDVVYRSLLPELGDQMLRSRVDMVSRDDLLELVIDSEDFTAMRATLNSVLRLVRIACELGKPHVLNTI